MRFIIYVWILIPMMGCSSSEQGLQPVTGKVVLKDKRAVKGAIIEFVSEGKTGARGKTDTEGRFELTNGGQKGAHPGKYQVAIIQMLVTDGAAAHAKAHHAALVIHPKYAKLETSGLTREVVTGSNDFTIELDTAAQK
jgi:hypothetical protein